MKKRIIQKMSLVGLILSGSAAVYAAHEKMMPTVQEIRSATGGDALPSRVPTLQSIALKKLGAQVAGLDSRCCFLNRCECSWYKNRKEVCCKELVKRYPENKCGAQLKIEAGNHLDRLEGNTLDRLTKECVKIDVLQSTVEAINTRMMGIASEGDTPLCLMVHQLIDSYGGDIKKAMMHAIRNNLVCFIQPLEDKAESLRAITTEMNKGCSSSFSLVCSLVENGYEDMLKILIANGLKGDWRSMDDYRNPLWIAVEKGSLRMVQCLMGARANITVKGDRRSDLMVLSFAAQEGNLEIVKCMIEEGTHEKNLIFDERTYVKNCFMRSSVLNDSFKRPLLLAVQKNHQDIAEYLVSIGAEVNSFTFEQQEDSPLGLAAKNGNMEMVKFLVDNGALINSLNRLEETPIDLAREHNHLGIVAFLTEKNNESNGRKRERDELESFGGDEPPAKRAKQSTAQEPRFRS